MLRTVKLPDATRIEVLELVDTEVSTLDSVSRNVDFELQSPVSNEGFAADVITGLSEHSKVLPPKYFYDSAGSRLFEEICLAPEYYVARMETALLQQIATEVAQRIPAGAALIEFGSGASDKTRIILDAAPQLAAYVPIDISEDALENASSRLRDLYPNLAIESVAGDFTQAIHLPQAVAGRVKIGFFPGSTIGNFSREQAVQFLRAAHRLLGQGALLLVGADMVKDEKTLIAAYDDVAGVTARFNKNLLARINRELGGSFDVSTFDHLAIWNSAESRIEMHLVSRDEQIVNAAGHTFAFKSGERLHTESSHKFTLDSFLGLATQADWSLSKHWISARPAFGVFLLRA